MKKSNIERCRTVIRDCLHVIEEHGDTYVAIHKEDEMECVVLVSIIRTLPILSIVVADKILFADENADSMYKAANELNAESVTGWHSIVLSNYENIYMYRQCIWINDRVNREYLLALLSNCLHEYRIGRAHLSSAIQPTE